MRIELTIKTSYLPDWGIWEGIRELVQNAKDAETEFSAPMTVRHRAPSTLVIENEGTVLPHEALLLGYSSKQDRSDMIGKFGEGLKLGILALVRKDIPVKIRSGSEVWVPRIVRSEKFNADVLAFDIHKGRKDERRVQIEIQGVTEDTWEKIRDRFLFLTKVASHKKITPPADSGTILLDPKYLGKVFVRGIHVYTNASLRYGYDLADVEVDRDRKMIDQASLRWRLTRLWQNAVKNDPGLVDCYIQLLDDQAADLEGLDSWSAKNLAEQVLDKVAARFQRRHGDNALPVTSLSQSAEIEHLGMTGVVVSGTLRAVLEAKLGTVEENKEKLQFLPKHTYSWSDLTEKEKTNLLEAIDRVNQHEPITLADVDVVDFRNDDTEGLFKAGRVLVAKKCIASKIGALTVLVHEAAHKHGSDGEMSHVRNIERIWGGIVEQISGAPS